MKRKLLIAYSWLWIGLFALGGCAHLDKSADPFEVRAEQSISMANATLDYTVAIDDANRDWWQTNVPAYHEFCEWLRAPIIVPPDNIPVQRGIAMIEGANGLRQTYKRSRSDGDKAELIAALAVLEDATRQAQSWLNVINSKPEPTP